MPTTGQMLLHYRVLDKIGEGGMGAVYKAQDTHLDRAVALKVLPHDKMSDPDRRQRFVQEAKAASSLNHPNIIIVHDIASDRGLEFIVMEYVEGRTLDQLIGRKGLPLGEALGLAAQVADGLAKAHAAGIVHRDLKPTNIMVTADGRVKILDFGLAKLTEDLPATAIGPTATLEGVDRPKTEEGFIMGTVAYMSPEQAEGKKVDARSDIFSFGSVLYEMLTGRKPFLRDSRIATLASILHEDPKPAADFKESLPPEIEQVLVRCLRKDPQRRWQSMSDIRVVLQDLKDDSDSGKLRAPQRIAARRRTKPLVWVGAGAIVLAAAILLWIFRPGSGVQPEYEIARLTFDAGMTWFPSISPDGKMFAFSSDRSGDGPLDIWVQQIAGGPPLRLTTHASDDVSPSFSPDGSKIVFASSLDGGGIYEVETLGGQERRIADRGSYPRYSPDGAWISYIDIPASLESRLIRMFLVPAQGGTPIPFLHEFCVVGSSMGSAPVWSPDAKHLIFNGFRKDDPRSLDWWVAPVAGGPAVRTGTHQALNFPPNWQCPSAWVNNYVYFSSGSTVTGINIFRTRIDGKSWRIDGQAERITSGPGMQFQSSVLPDGRLIYANAAWFANVWTLEAKPDLGQVGTVPVPVSRDLLAKFDFSLSRDGSKMVYNAFGGQQGQGQRFEVRLTDLSTGEEKTYRMRADRFGQMPRISPDGSVFSYRDSIEGELKTFLVTERGASVREIGASCAIRGFFGDPRFALVSDDDRRLSRLDLDSGERTPLLQAVTGTIRAPALSPDDRWIGFVIGLPSGRVALYIAPLAAPPALEKDWILLFDEDEYLDSPAWSPDGAHLYYLSQRDGSCSIWVQKLDPKTKRPDGDTRPVYRSPQSRFNLNFPPGNGLIAVARDKLALWMCESTGNIYLATPKQK